MSPNFCSLDDEETSQERAYSDELHEFTLRGTSQARSQPNNLYLTSERIGTALCGGSFAIRGQITVSF